MTAVDTNVVVRLLVGDDARQAASARALFAAGPIWIAKTVLLETHWVLRRLYGFDDQAIAAALTNLLGLKNVHAEDVDSIPAALALMQHGIDFVDALHLSSRPPGVGFVSFDRTFIARARRAGAPAVSIVVATHD